MATFALNFSRPGAQVVAQYYTFIAPWPGRLRSVQQASRDVATSLAAAIADLGPFRLLTRGDELPVFAFTTGEKASFNVFDVSRRLKERGCLVPANTFPENREDLAVLRVVCRNGFTLDLASMFLNALRAAMPELERQTSPTTSPGGATAFHH